LEHAFFCGLPPTNDEIDDALRADEEIAFRPLGSTSNPHELESIADLLAFLIAQDGVVGLYQGIAETGPRDLGHRSILANPCNPDTLDTINKLVKFRERIRPLAPMVTLEAAREYFELSDGAAEDEYNAYNYMVLTVPARPLAYTRIPAVVHKDGTCRIQIVRQEQDPFSYAFLKAMGRRVGAEVSVNTSLNVGGPIAQTPGQALGALKRAKALTGLILIAAEGDTRIAWHNVSQPPKDRGQQLLHWYEQWLQETTCSSAQEPPRAGACAGIHDPNGSGRL
jgi:carbamoyltransferase